MKLQDLDSSRKTQQYQKVFESYFGKKVNFTDISKSQAQQMLEKVRGLIREHRNSSRLHTSERNPNYLKLMVMEQALAAKVSEGPAGRARPAGRDQYRTGTQGTQGTQGSQGTTDLTQMTPQERKAAETAAEKVSQGQTNLSPQEKAAMQKSTQMVAKTQASSADRMKMQQLLKQSANESVVLESEVQQAQVVLAAQDMVDRIQDTLEDVTEMKFKDLPALVDSIRNEVGMDQAQRYSTEVSAALDQLIACLQENKTAIEGAQGILTGQEPVVPGDGEGDVADLGEPADMDMDMEVDAEADAEEEPSSDLEASLGRARR